jgi:Tfp pilus assembly protein PilO
VSKLFKVQALYTLFSRFSKRERMVFYVAASFVLVMFLDRLIISPIYQNLRSLDKEVSERQATLAQDMRIVAQKERILAEANKYSSFVNVPKSDEEVVTVLLKEIEGVAAQSAIYLVDMKPGGVKTEGANKKYIVNVSCEGRMEQIADFMYKIENSSKLLKVERYQIAPKAKESTSAACSMSISEIVMP